MTWTSIKSWWYWNVSSKYDATDAFVYIGFPLMIVGMIYVAYLVHQNNQELVAACEAKGGALISTQTRRFCVDKEALINVR